MPNNRHRRDTTHKAVKEAFEKDGCTVADTSQLGGGCPDMFVADPEGVTFPVEVKSGKGNISGAQVAFAQHWNGPVYVVRDVETARSTLKYWRGMGGPVPEIVKCDHQFVPDNESGYAWLDRCDKCGMLRCDEDEGLM